MLRSIVTLVLFAWIFCLSQGDKAEPLYTCTAWGDPHVTRFPTDPDEKPTEVWCQQTGSNSLVVNKYLTSNIVVTETPYIIIKFNVAFLDDKGAPICTVTQAEFATPSADCDNGVVLTRNGDTITIAYKKRDILVTIRQDKWNNGKYTHYYSLWVSQSGPLIEESTGLCKSSCDPVTGQTLIQRKRRAVSNNDANSNKNSIQKNAASICQTFISKVVPKFQSTSLNTMDIKARNAYTSCVKDLEITGDLSFAKASVESFTVNTALTGLTTASDFQAFSEKLFGRINEAGKLMDKEISEFKVPSTPASNDVSVVFLDNTEASLSCRSTWSKKITVVSAKYESRSSSCFMDATARVQALCAESPRSCQFTVSTASLRKDPCDSEDKQLRIVYRCQ